MQTTSVASFQKNMSALLAQTIKYNEPLNVYTEDGNVIILSDEDYRGMVETVRLLSIPGMREKLLEGKSEPLSECVPEDEVEW